ncbi:MAG TPA: CHAP domain-containing protein [Azospirillaceae bacterium]|nr:CHAP domain-containing protein [Azospirillaceae bacterium]
MHTIARKLVLMIAIVAGVVSFAGKAHALACVFWARQLTDLAIQGDAWQWWDGAAGRYERTSQPAVGSVLVFQQAREMRRGHVSTVSRLVDSRTVEVDHSWLKDNKLYRGMRVVDVSARNDWTRVRVWHPGINDLGTTVYATYGFVHPDRPRRDLLQVAVRENAPIPVEQRSVVPSQRIQPQIPVQARSSAPRGESRAVPAAQPRKTRDSAATGGRSQTAPARPVEAGRAPQAATGTAPARNPVRAPPTPSAGSNSGVAARADQ